MNGTGKVGQWVKVLETTTRQKALYCHLESFSVYLKPADKGRILASQVMSNVDGILTAQGGVEGVRSDGSAKKRARK